MDNVTLSAEPDTRPLLYYTVEQYAEIMQLAKETVLRQLRSGRIKGFKVGRQWRIYRNEVIKPEPQN